MKPLKRAWRILFATLLAVTAASAQDKKPNILVIWGDDIGTGNISYHNRGMMGYQTPNIDRVGREGVFFTDYYGQQSCTAGRAAFINGSCPVRTGMTKVGIPGAPEGWQKTDVTMATVMKSLGYMTGQFGKNHQGDRDEHLPTMHGFDEFLGNLYHLNAEEEPENEDYPGDMVLPGGKTFKQVFGPRGVLHVKSDGKGGQTIKDTGPLTRKRMETIDEETVAAAKEFITRMNNEGKPFFCWWNGTRMHFRTHVKAEHRHKGNDEYTDGMIEHDLQVGELLKLIDDLGIADNTIVQYSTDNGPHYNTWPDAGTTPFRSEKNSNWEGAYRVPCFIRWPGHFPAGAVRNGIVSHEDWLPTFAAAGGNPDIVEQLKKGVELNGRTYKNFIDGANQIDYISGKSGESPRPNFMYVNDDGNIVAMRYNAWKAVFLENRGQAFEVWREPFTELRVPLLFNLRRDPYEKAQHNNGAHEQFHRVLKRETLQPPTRTRQGQQHRTSGWLQCYNQERPHEALGQRAPVKFYRKSGRRYPQPLPPVKYPADWTVRQVRSNGEIRWQGRRRFVGEAFVGQPVGLKRLRRGVWRVYFLHLRIGHLHEADAGAMRPMVYRHRRRGHPKTKV